MRCFPNGLFLETYRFFPYPRCAREKAQVWELGARGDRISSAACPKRCCKCCLPVSRYPIGAHEIEIVQQIFFL